MTLLSFDISKLIDDSINFDSRHKVIVVERAKNLHGIFFMQECSHGSGKCWRMRRRMRSGGSVEWGKCIAGYRVDAGERILI